MENAVHISLAANDHWRQLQAKQNEHTAALSSSEASLAAATKKAAAVAARAREAAKLAQRAAAAATAATEPA